MSETDYDVIVCGYGPVGATAANLLGQYGIRTLILEKEDAVYRLPRAGTCDDEVMRIWQSIGLADELMAQFLPQEVVQFLAADGRPFLEPRRQSFGYGFPALTLLYQPLLEETLRRSAEELSSVDVRLEHEVTEFVENAISSKSWRKTAAPARKGDSRPGTS